MGYALHKYDALYFCIFVTVVSSCSYSFRMGGGVPMGIGHVWGKDFASSIWEFILEKLCHNCQNRFFFFLLLVFALLIAVPDLRLLQMTPMGEATAGVNTIWNSRASIQMMEKNKN